MHESLQNLTNACLSGGADGADIEWGLAAHTINHEVIHWSFPGHRSQAPEEDIIRLNDEELSLADETIKAAAKILKKSPPSRSSVSPLIQRNYYQVAWSESCYAVTYMVDGELSPGGTTWAIAMFRHLHPGNHDIYVFDQVRESWFQFDGETWVGIDSPPRPTDIWAGIGARELQQCGRDAIRKLMDSEKTNT
jgi:hypothetical protein